MYWKNKDRVVFREFLVTLGRGGGKNGFLSTLGAFLFQSCTESEDTIQQLQQTQKIRQNVF